jgi:hypothetical protein
MLVVDVPTPSFGAKQMWPFRQRKPKAVKYDPTERYRTQPMNLFFEALILDVLGELAPDREAEIDRLNLPTRLNTASATWRGAVRESLHLSDTIDVAILDLWHTNREVLKTAADRYTAEDFARDFADKYFEDGSQIDVWPDDALQQAKWRLAKRQTRV